MYVFMLKRTPGFYSDLFSRKPIRGTFCYQQPVEGKAEAWNVKELAIPGLRSGMGALLDVSLTPIAGYERVVFPGCTQGARRFFGKDLEEDVTSTRDLRKWVVWTKLLKTERAPR